MKPNDSLPSLATALHGVATQQIDVALAALRRASSGRHEGIHAARKAIRQFRALVKLLPPRTQMALARVDRRMRKLGKSLSALRDARVAMRTAAALAKTTTNADRALWLATRDASCRRRDAVLSEALRADAGFARRVAVLESVRAKLAATVWSTITAPALWAELDSSASQVEEARQRFARRPSSKRGHRYRRRVRRLRMQLRCLEKIAARPLSASATRILRVVLGRARKSIGDAAELSLISDTLGTTQDRALLRRALVRERDLPRRDRARELLKESATDAQS